MTHLKLCTWDGEPLLWTHCEAWVFADGKWRPTESVAAGMEARVVCAMDESESRKLIETLRRMVRERKD
jgi:hypothetical protein